MPTGYTHGVGEGTVTDFRTFALQCARAFGATTMQRDEPHDEPPKHRTPSDYYDKQLAQARERIKWLRTLTLEDAQAQAQLAYDEDELAQKGYAAKRAETRRRYEAMLVEVELWRPPSANHVEMKAFMRSQLVESIDFDCRKYAHEYPTRDGAKWLEQETKRTLENIGRYAEEVAKEQARCEEANAWIDALYTSLPPAEATASST